MSQKGPIEWADLRERLQEAARNLDALAKDVPDPSRLNAKVAGVKLALGYMDEYDR